MLVKIENILFAINKSDVHEPVDSDTYIGFGKAKNENLSAQSRASAAEQSTKHCHLHAGTDSEDQRDVDEADDDDTDEAIIQTCTSRGVCVFCLVTPGERIFLLFRRLLQDGEIQSRLAQKRSSRESKSETSLSQRRHY